MGIFSRFTDIISSNINHMLDSAEDPEKLIRLMLREMEETLVELKSSCASTMAEASVVRRQLDECIGHSAQWQHRAELALRAGREDMAREALDERIQLDEQSEVLTQELEGFDNLVDKCREDIRLLEERIQNTRDRQRLLVERHGTAQIRRQAREKVRAADNSDTMKRFASLDQRITRMENEADLVYQPVVKHSAFQDLERSSAVDEQLEALRRQLEDEE